MAQETELKLQKVKFTKALRGYSCEEVDTYAAYVNDRYNTLARECVELRRKMAAMAAGQNEFREDALREKEKIAAEADALLQAGKAEADRLTEEAMRKAARMLAEAEAAAAGILRKAEAEAAERLEARRAEEEKAIGEAEQALARRNNAADRLIEEIDSFREEVFVMYGKHIEELERLSRLTDRFYQEKEELTDGLLPHIADDAENMVSANGTDAEADEIYLSPEEAADAPGAEDADAGEVYEEPAETAEDGTAFDEDEDLLRIDWKKHRASRETAEETAESEIYEDPAWEIPAEPEDTGNALGTDDVWSDPEEDFFPDAPAAREDHDGEDFDESCDFLPDDGEDGDDAEPVQESEEDFLSGIASEYFAPQQTADPRKAAPSAAKPVQSSARPAENGGTGNLDDLFYDEEAKNVSLTGEFDIIFNSKKSAANVAQIDRQPLVAAQKPEKPKKHGNGTNK